MRSDLYKFSSTLLYVNPLFWIAFICFIQSCENPETPNSPFLVNATDSVQIFSKGLVSTELYERDIAIHPDGSSIIYTLSDYKQKYRCLVELKKINGSWKDPKILEFSGRFEDIEPFFTPSGDKLFFASNRPLNSSDSSSDFNIWYTELDSLGNWLSPMALDSTINTSADEFYPAVAKEGNLYFTSTRENGLGREDIFRSSFVNGSFQMASVLDSNINTEFYEFNAYVDPDERFIIFSSFGREDGLGGGDLYLSTKEGSGTWSKAKNMGSLINSESLDFCPFVDISSGVFYFTSDRRNQFEVKIETLDELKSLSNSILNGMGNIYYVKASALGLEL